MRIDGIYYDYIPLEKITPIYTEYVSKSAKSKMIRLLSKGNSLSSHVIVESDKQNGLYWLVAGYPEYEAYRSLFYQKNFFKEIPSVIQPYTSKTHQRIILLRRMFLNQPTKWTDKHNIISSLIEMNKSIKEIANAMGTTSSQIEEYLIHPDIPPEIINLARENRGSFQTLEKIRKLRLHKRITENLYELAVKKVGSPDRLTGEKLKMIKLLLSNDRFWELRPADKWDLILISMTFRKTIECTWNTEIEKRLT